MVIEMVGGMVVNMMGCIIVSNGQFYVVKDSEKMIFEMLEEDMEEGQEVFVNQDQAKKVDGEIMEIFGYICYKYVFIIVNDEGGKIEQVIWVIDVFKVFQLFVFNQGNVLVMGFFGFINIEGFLMWIEIVVFGVDGGLIMEVIKLDEVLVDVIYFEKLEGYIVKFILEMMKF